MSMTDFFDVIYLVNGLSWVDLKNVWKTIMFTVAVINQRDSVTVLW